MRSLWGPKKVQKLEEKTGRVILFAVPWSDKIVEFVTPSHEHFWFNRRNETFKLVPTSDLQHYKHCRLVFEESKASEEPDTGAIPEDQG